MKLKSHLFALAPSAAVALSALAMTAPAGAAMDHGHGAHQMAAAPADAQGALSEGTVKKVDKAAGKITISHGPLENLGMPSMTMVFRAADPSLLDDVKAGDKIRFAADRVEGVFMVTKLEVAK